MKKILLASLLLFLLTGCNEKTINDGLKSLSEVETAISQNELVSAKEVKLMGQIFDYYYENEVSESEKELYVVYLELKRDVEIYNNEINKKDYTAADITKLRIQEGIEKLK